MDLHHPILREFPEHRDTIRRLKGSDDHFRHVFDEYHRLDDEIYRIEEEIDFATDREIEGLHLSLDPSRAGALPDLCGHRRRPISGLRQLSPRLPVLTGRNGAIFFADRACGSRAHGLSRCAVPGKPDG
jgi:uncharacterized protein YdcH (DUF465 family)